MANHWKNSFWFQNSKIKSFPPSYLLVNFVISIDALSCHTKSINMATEILSQEDLKQFRIQLLDDLKVHFPQSTATPKQWLKSSEVRKMLSISHGTLQNLKINNKNTIHTLRRLLARVHHEVL
jgi:hypothetical protein